MKKKYKLTNKTINIDGAKLHRIQALIDFSNVKAGDLGGWIEKEENLSQAGEAWVYDDAKVKDDAKVRGNARLFDNVEVRGNANVYDHAELCDNAKVNEEASVYGHSNVYGYAEVYGCASVYDHAEVYGYAEICELAMVFGSAAAFDNATIFGKACIHGNAKVSKKDDYIVFKNFWSSGRYFTWTRSNNMWSAGCFYGTGWHLIKKAYRDSEKSGREYERVVRYVESILADENKEQVK